MKKDELFLLDNKIFVRCSRDKDYLVKKVPGYKWDAKLGVWEFPYGVWRYEMLKDLITGADLHLQLTTKVSGDKLLSAVLVHMRNDKENTPQLEDEYWDGLLFKHQKQCLVWAMTAYDGGRKGICIWDDVGLGKTLEALSFFDVMSKRKEFGRMVVMCEKSLIHKWRDEAVEKARRSAIAVFGSKEQRKKCLRNWGDVYVINYDCALMFPEFIAELIRGQLLCIDEAQVLRTPWPKTQLLRFVESVNPRFTIQLSATPVYSALHNVFNQVRLADETAWKNWGEFQTRHIVKGGYGGYEIIGYSKKDEIKSKMDNVSIRRLKEEVVDLPEKTFEDRFLEMDKDQKEAYETMRDDCLYQWGEMEEQELLSRWSAISAQLIRLSQICDGFLSDSFRLKWFKSNQKLKELETLLERFITASDKKVVVWSSFVPVVTMLQNKFQKKYGSVMLWGGVDSEDRRIAIDRFQYDKSCRLFIGQTHTGGVGIDLIAGKSPDKKRVWGEDHYKERIVIFYKVPWESGAWIQATGRCHRIGMTGSLSVISLIVSDSVEEKMVKYLRKNTLESFDLTGDIPKLKKTEIINLLR